MTKHEIAKLFDTHALTLYKFVYLRVGNQADAEDIVSTVFEKVLKYHDGYQEQPGATVRSWLFAITRTTIVDHYRRTHCEVLPLEDAEHMPSDAQSVSELADLRMSWDQVREGIAMLPDRQQEIVLLRYQSDLSNTEIAQVLGIDQHTVASALSKALTTLRTLFKPRL